MKELLSIKEFAELSGIESSTLRYWDETKLFSPAKRNPDTGYRYYSLVQLLMLNFITTLSDIHVNLKTIGELDSERDPDKFINLLDRQEKQLNMEMRKLRMAYAIIHARRELVSYGMKVTRGEKVKYGGIVDPNAISVLHRDDRPINLGPRNMYQPGETFIDKLADLVEQSNDLHLNLSMPVGGYHDSFESFINAPAKPDHFFSNDPTGNRKRQEGEYLIGFAKGDYGEFGDLPQRMAAYAQENSLTLDGPVLTFYLLDELSCQDPSQYLAQSCIEVVKKRKIK